MSITSEVQVNMVHKEEFLDLKAESGELLSHVNELKVFRKSAEDKMTEDHYQIIKNTHIVEEV